LKNFNPTGDAAFH